VFILLLGLKPHSLTAIYSTLQCSTIPHRRHVLVVQSIIALIHTLPLRSAKPLKTLAVMMMAITLSLNGLLQNYLMIHTLLVLLALVFFRRSYVLYWEPCKLISEYDFTLTQEVKNSSSQLIVEGDVIVTAENTLIDSFPFTNFLTRRRGEREYLTVKMDKQRFWTSSNTVMTISGDTPFYENKNLVIQMSVDSNHYLSSYLTEVIFATGDQCIWGYNPESKDRFVMNVPNGISKWNVTLPGREIWFLAFSGPMMSDVQVDYLVVDDRQSDIPNSSFILYVDFKLMAVLIFLFIFLK